MPVIATPHQIAPYRFNASAYLKEKIIREMYIKIEPDINDRTTEQRMAVIIPSALPVLI